MNSNIMAYGDIHGCYKAAETAVSLAEELKARAVFLGDYVDRGTSAIKTINILVGAKAIHPNWIFLRGNHEQMLLDLIEGKHHPEDIGQALDGAMFSYNQSKESFEEWKALSGEEQNKITRFLKTTQSFYETTNYIFVHAIIRDTGERLIDKPEKELLWNYEHRPYWSGKEFIHGHKLCKEIEKINKGVNINTECGYGGHLTGLLINMKTSKPITVFSISECGDLLNEEKY